MEEFDHLKITLQDITSATGYFARDNLIGHGGFGSVYKGELSDPPEGPITVACKRLDRKFGQGDVEFLKEILMLSNCKHENLVSLLHFCIEGDERILVYEYASRGSLDRYLSDPSLTWTQRLKICIGAAKALKYLHDPKKTQQRILHRDIKSSNILLDEEWNAKVSDFGLSKIGPANQPQTYLVSNAVGTPGYCDPLYSETGILSKESDVYSFGVVLFEVMCGTLCCEYCDGRLLGILVPKWKKCFEEKRVDDIIRHGLHKHVEPASLNTFSTIAYQCLKRARKERPTMAYIMRELNRALKLQEIFEDFGKTVKFEEMPGIADLAVTPSSGLTQTQLLLLFMNGVHLDDGNTWFSVNKKGQHCELISAHKCISRRGLFMWERADTNLGSRYVPRFKDLHRYDATRDLTLRLMTQFLSPNVTYVINLVFKCINPRQSYGLHIPFKYKLEEMREYSTSCVAHVGEDGWLRTELFLFTSTKKKHCFNIHMQATRRPNNLSPVFNEMLYAEEADTFIAGVEFCPVDIFESEKNENKVGTQPTDIDWEERLPEDYTKIVEDIHESMTMKEVYFLLRKGVYINNSQQWFSISKKSKKRLMLPARTILPKENKSVWKFLSKRKSWLWKPLPGSRFKEAAECCDKNRLDITFKFKTELLSMDIMYACYLVFKLPENASVFENIVIVHFRNVFGEGYTKLDRRLYLVTPPHTPIIEVSPGDERPSRTRKIKGHPKLRKDGWMEIQVWEFLLRSRPNTFWVDGYLKSLNEWNFTGLLVQGIEFRPAKLSWDYSKPVYA